MLDETKGLGVFLEVPISITAREIFAKYKELKKVLWGGNLWTSGFYANTVGQFAMKM